MNKAKSLFFLGAENNIGVLFFLMTAYLMPAMGGSIALRPVFFMLIAYLFVCFSKSPFYPAVRFLFLYAVLAMLSTLYGAAFYGVELVAGDWFEIVRLFCVCAVFWWGWEACVDIDIIRILGVVLFVIFIIGMVQYFALDGGFLLKLYAASTQLEAAQGFGLSYKRMVFTLGNPNDAGIFFCLAGIFFLSAYFVLKNNYILLLFFISVFCLGLTQSKTGLVAFVFGVFSVFILLRRWWWMVFFFIAFLWVSFFFRENLLYIWNFADALLDRGLADIYVFSARLSNSEEAFSLWTKSPFWGWGVVKSSHPTVVDVEYALVLRRYGLVGVFCLFLFFVDLHKNLSVTADNGLVRIYSIFFISTTFPILMFMLSNNFFNSYYNHFLYIFLVGQFFRLLASDSKHDYLFFR